MTVFFTADHHFDHLNIIKYVKRPFADTGEMNRVMISRWNETVGQDDTTYHLGDFVLGNVNHARAYLAQLKGKIIVIPAGHDRNWVKTKEILYSRSGFPVEIWPKLCELKIDKETITLCHYPMYSWEQSHYGALHLHGHCHGTIGVVSQSGDKQLPPGQAKGWRVDVGVDNWEFRPITLSQIKTSLALARGS